jgi:hypothetical protein
MYALYVRVRLYGTYVQGGVSVQSANPNVLEYGEFRAFGNAESVGLYLGMRRVWYVSEYGEFRAYGNAESVGLHLGMRRVWYVSEYGEFGATYRSAVKLATYRNADSLVRIEECGGFGTSGNAVSLVGVGMRRVWYVKECGEFGTYRNAESLVVSEHGQFGAYGNAENVVLPIGMRRIWYMWKMVRVWHV